MNGPLTETLTSVDFDDAVSVANAVKALHDSRRGCGNRFRSHNSRSRHSCCSAEDVPAVTRSLALARRRGVTWDSAIEHREGSGRVGLVVVCACGELSDSNAARICICCGIDGCRADCCHRLSPPTSSAVVTTTGSPNSSVDTADAPDATSPDPTGGTTEWHAPANAFTIGALPAGFAIVAHRKSSMRWVPQRATLW